MTSATKQCVNCGQHIPYTADFCENCGTNQSEVAGQFQHEAPPKKRPKWLLWGGAALAVCCVFFLIVVAIAPSPETSPASNVSEPANNEQSQSVAAATATPEPDIPTATPLPTDTPTPEPTPTPIPPTATPTPEPEPLLFEGTGDSVVDVSAWDGAGLMRVSGNEATAHFAVKYLDQSNELIDIPVNTVEAYGGIHPLGFNGKPVSKLEISATGSWKIEILPLSNARVLAIPGEITGSGDELIILDGPPNTASISGNAGQAHFAVKVFAAAYNLRDVAVNTVDVYEGQVIIKSDAKYLHVTSTGEWSIKMD